MYEARWLIDDTMCLMPCLSLRMLPVIHPYTRPGIRKKIMIAVIMPLKKAECSTV
jgi:hypothetical protein